MREDIFADPQITPFIECPNCCRLLEYGTSRCPDCYEEIREDYALLSGAVVAINTKACAMANTIRTMDVTAIIAIAVMLVSYFLNDRSFLIAPLMWPMLALAAIVIWFVRFGRFKLGDADYQKARGDMARRLAGWAILFLGLAAFYLFQITN